MVAAECCVEFDRVEFLTSQHSHASYGTQWSRYSTADGYVAMPP
jgi:hypothetical protein